MSSQNRLLPCTKLTDEFRTGQSDFLHGKNLILKELNIYLSHWWDTDSAFTFVNERIQESYKSPQSQQP